MGAIVNRELKQRVRPVNGIVAHRPVAKADIKHAAKIIQNLDHKWNIWDDNDEKQDKEKQVSHWMYKYIISPLTGITNSGTVSYF